MGAYDINVEEFLIGSVNLPDTEEHAVEEKEATEKKVVMNPESNIEYIIITDGGVPVIVQPKG
ncbi:MAG: hypothetical protein E3J35_09415 [Methanomassiliicoccales archaeon]|nr:MAG: hypothetical protein E3J35_09415 [Methanomassiliicoccales archaeon]